MTGDAREALAKSMSQAKHLLYSPVLGGGAEVHMVEPTGDVFHLGLVLPGKWSMVPVKGGKVWWPDVAVPRGMDDAMDQLRRRAAQRPDAPWVVVIVP